MRVLSACIDRAARVILGGTAYARWKGVKMGKGCRILSCNLGSEPFLIELGDRVGVASHVTFITHDGSTWLLRDESGRKYRYAPIRVGNDVFVGFGAIILPGVEIGNRVIVGAGSVVTKSVPSGSVVAGNPARVIGSFEEYAARQLPSEAEKVGNGHTAQVLSLVAKR
jgi:acetyltransferase-like isoleucine patch superfamily enzyme